MKGTKRSLKDAEEFTRGTTTKDDVLRVCRNAVKGKRQDSQKQMAAKTTNTSHNKAEANLSAIIHLLSPFGFFFFFDCLFKREINEEIAFIRQIEVCPHFSVAGTWKYT